MMHQGTERQAICDTRKPATFWKISGTNMAGLAAGLLIGASVLLATGSAWAKTTLKIVSPMSGDSVSSEFPVKYAYHKEGRANHVHIFVDGNFLEATHDNPVTLTLPSGHHTVMLRAASKHHHLLKAKASVDVTVK